MNSASEQAFEADLFSIIITTELTIISVKANKMVFQYVKAGLKLFVV